MKPLLAPFAIALLSCGLPACGGTGTGASSAGQGSSNLAATSAGAPAGFVESQAGSYLKSDGDQDGDDRTHHVGPSEDDDVAFLASYGKEADQADKQAVKTVTRRYYAAAAAGDSVQACAQLSSTLSSGLVEGQGGSTCASVISPLLAQQHKRLAADNVTTMVVIDVRVKGDLGLAVLGFKATPISQIVVKREKGAWKVDSLFDSVIR